MDQLYNSVLENLEQVDMTPALSAILGVLESQEPTDPHPGTENKLDQNAMATAPENDSERHEKAVLVQIEEDGNKNATGTAPENEVNGNLNAAPLQNDVYPNPSATGTAAENEMDGHQDAAAVDENTPNSDRDADPPNPEIVVMCCTFCVFCDINRQPVKKFSDHLKSNHHGNPDRDRVENMPKGSEKNHALEELRKLGNLRKNQKTLQEKKGILAVMTPQNEGISKDYRDYTLCKNCGGEYLKSGLERHLKKDRCGRPDFVTKSVAVVEHLWEVKQSEEGSGFGLDEAKVTSVRENLTSHFKGHNIAKGEYILKDALLVNFIHFQFKFSKISAVDTFG